MTDTITIGRRTVTFENFLNAVKNSKRYTEVCDYLGFNRTVGSTKDAIKQQIEALGIDISHFEYKYTKSEKYDQAAKQKRKTFNISPINQPYYDIMEQKFEDKPQSWGTYKVDVGGILEYLREKDFATITIQEIEDYAGDKKSAVLHVRSMLITTVKENINNAVEQVSKDMLIWLI
ncbi:MAG: hypothetical protein M0P49_02520 [Bacilli bacterium]|nr:hypothetical protein [Bacilli bacterium]